MNKKVLENGEISFLASLKPISFEEHKQLQLEILENVASFCEKENLEYFLISGTLLGAVRHKGFIPWDDDIDIVMPRASYNRLIELYNNQSFSDKFYLVNPREPMARHSIVKIINKKTIKIEPGIKYENGYLGVDIDIFPMDGEPEKEADFLVFWKKLNRIYRIFNRFTADGALLSFKGKFLNFFLKMIYKNKNNILDIAEKIHKEYLYENSFFVGPVAHAYNETNNRFKKEWFRDFVMLDFEGKKFRAPIDYDAVLGTLWRNYMEWPPEDQRITHHSGCIYWKDENI